MPMLQVDGGSIYFNIKGEGIPIVFIHPPLLTSANFYHQVNELSKSYKVITFDIRGHGRSMPSHQPISYPLIVEDIKALLDTLEIQKAFICGYSTGGSILLEFLLTYSERSFGGIVISGMSEVSDLYNRKRIQLAKKLAHPKSLEMLARAISWGNSENKETFEKLFSEACNGDAVNIHQYYDYSLHYHCTNQLSEINLPMLLVYGSKDKAFHRYAQLLHNQLQHSELKFLTKEKHQLPTKAAKKLNQLIQQFVHVCTSRSTSRSADL